MRKAQTTVEYLIFMIMAIILCVAFGAFWNKLTMTTSVTGGVSDQHGVIHVPPMSP